MQSFPFRLEFIHAICKVAHSQQLDIVQMKPYIFLELHEIRHLFLSKYLKSQKFLPGAISNCIFFSALHQYNFLCLFAEWCNKVCNEVNAAAYANSSKFCSMSKVFGKGCDFVSTFKSRMIFTDPLCSGIIYKRKPHLIPLKGVVFFAISINQVYLSAS